MSTSHLGLIATVAVVAAAATTGAVTGLLAADANTSFAVIVALAGALGAAISGITVLLILAGRLGTAPQVTTEPDPAALAAELVDQVCAIGADCLNLRVQVPGVSPAAAREQIIALGRSVLPLLRADPRLPG